MKQKAALERSFSFQSNYINASLKWSAMWSLQTSEFIYTEFIHCVYLHKSFYREEKNISYGYKKLPNIKGVHGNGF